MKVCPSVELMHMYFDMSVTLVLPNENLTGVFCLLVDFNIFLLNIAHNVQKQALMTDLPKNKKETLQIGYQHVFFLPSFYKLLKQLNS